MDMVRRIITAEIFHERAGDGITNEVGGEYLTVEFFASEEPGQQEVKQEIIHTVIKLGGMHRQRRGIGSHARKPLLILGIPRIRMIWKLHCPRYIRRATKTAAIEKTADPTKKVSQSNTGREHVGSFPDWQFFPYVDQ